MILFNRYKVIDIKKFKRFIFITVFLVSIFIFLLMTSINVYSKDIPQFSYVNVKEGDTIWSIASRFSYDGDIREFIFNISKENNLSNWTIYPGDIIKIPLKP